MTARRALPLEERKWDSVEEFAHWVASRYQFYRRCRVEHRLDHADVRATVKEDEAFLLSLGFPTQDTTQAEGYGSPDAVLVYVRQHDLHVPGVT